MTICGLRTGLLGKELIALASTRVTRTASIIDWVARPKLYRWCHLLFPYTVLHTEQESVA